MTELGKWLIIAGAVLALVGVVLLLAGKVPWIGRLPGDIRISGRGGSSTSPWPPACC